MSHVVLGPSTNVRLNQGLAVQASIAAGGFDKNKGSSKSAFCGNAREYELCTFTCIISYQFRSRVRGVSAPAGAMVPVSPWIFEHVLKHNESKLDSLILKLQHLSYEVAMIGGKFYFRVEDSSGTFRPYKQGQPFGVSSTSRSERTPTYIIESLLTFCFRARGPPPSCLFACLPVCLFACLTCSGA